MQESILINKENQDIVIGEEEIYFLDKLNQFEAPFLEEKLLQNGKFKSKEDYQKAFVEFKKYAALVKISGKKLGMTSKEIDEVWHQFILFTKEYHNFCDKFLNGYMHHSPNISSTPKNKMKQETKNLVSAYKAVFGNIPTIWGIEGSWCNSGCGGCAGCGSGTSDCSGGSGCSGCNACSSCS